MTSIGARSTCFNCRRDTSKVAVGGSCVHHYEQMVWWEPNSCTRRVSLTRLGVCSSRNIAVMFVITHNDSLWRSHAGQFAWSLFDFSLRLYDLKLITSCCDEHLVVSPLRNVGFSSKDTANFGGICNSYLRSMRWIQREQQMQSLKRSKISALNQA